MREHIAPPQGSMKCKDCTDYRAESAYVIEFAIICITTDEADYYPITA